MSKRVFVGNLSYDTTNDSLRAAFEAQNLSVADAHVVLDRETGQPRGFGFVEFTDEAQAARAVQECDGLEVDRRNIRVSEARDREQRGPGGPPRGPGRGGPGGPPRRFEGGDRPPRRFEGGGGDRPPRRFDGPGGGGGGGGGGFDRPPRPPRSFDDQPQEGQERPRRERKPKPPVKEESRRAKGARKMPPGGHEQRKKQPRYRDVDDWEDDEELY